MEKPIRIIALAILIALGILAWRYFFPNPERIIKANLKDLAETASFEGNAGTITQGLKADRIGNFFDTNVEIEVNVRGYNLRDSIDGRATIRQHFLGAQQNLNRLKINFIDVNVTLQPDGETAVANVTFEGEINKENTGPQELNITFKKREREWLITRIETVRTLLQFLVPKALPRAA